MIFLERAKSDKKTCTESILTYESTSIPYWCIKTDDFGEVYSLIKSERKIPVNLFRMFKEQLYQLSLTEEPTRHISVIGADKIENYSDIEFIIGFEVSKLSLKGYESIDRKELIEDILFDNKNYNKKELLDKTIPRLLKSTNFVPVYKYLNGIGIHSTKELQEKGYYENTKKSIDTTSYSATQEQYKKDFKTIKDKNLKSIIEFSKLLCIKTNTYAKKRCTTFRYRSIKKIFNRCI